MLTLFIRAKDGAEQPAPDEGLPLPLTLSEDDETIIPITLLPLATAHHVLLAQATSEAGFTTKQATGAWRIAAPHGVTSAGGRPGRRAPRHLPSSGIVTGEGGGNGGA